MSDLARQMREKAQGDLNAPFWRAAAAEIERLTKDHEEQCRLLSMSAERELKVLAQRDRLAEALQKSLDWLASYPGGNAEGAYDRARAALDSIK